jgi:hypothetical protein
MTRPSRVFLISFSVLAILGASAFDWLMVRKRPVEVIRDLANVDKGKVKDREEDQDTVEVTDYARPKDADDLLVDDRIEDKKTSFDPSLVDPRPVGQWSLNASDAVIKLDVPMARPDQEPELLVLHPSYASAVKGVYRTVLPSVNMIDGKAKQFDDGLYAAIDQAYYLGHGEAMKGHSQTIRRIFDKVAKPGGAADYLAAGLSLGGERFEASPQAKSLATEFLSQEVWSKPIGFYTWTRPLSDCFRVLRFFSMPIEDNAIPVEIARVLREDKALRDDYVKAYTFYARLTNPLLSRTPADLIDGPPLKPDERATLFPPSNSRENELFERLFPVGLPSDARLMRELITAIRSGKIDLKPREHGGWYDHQVYALETLLLPERGAEANKLLLSKTYKKRMIEAFQALMTKRRESHLLHIKFGAKMMGPVEELPHVAPRLRVEPNPTYYLRTARSYAFLANLLDSTLGDSTLKTLRGLREGGERELDLDAELRWMRDLFYGLALLSAEDIGFKINLIDGEPIDRSASETIAKDWLAKIDSDRDLAADTRVSVPVYYEPRSGLVRIWATVGVRLTALEAVYVTPPSLRKLDGTGDWQRLEVDKLYPSHYLIPVDEFAEVEVKGGRVLSRAEFRSICDRMKTKANIVEALEK